MKNIYKILKEGHLPEPKQDKPYRGECAYCHCQVECMFEEGHSYRTFLCPTVGCGGVIELKKYTPETVGLS